MSRKTRDAFSYPRSFWETIERAATGQKTSLVLPTIREAQSLRGKFYAFRASLQKTLHNALLKKDPVAGMQIKELEQAHQFARVTVCWFDEKLGEPVKVWYMSKDETPEALLLAEALKRSEAEAATTPPTQAQIDADAEAEASAERVRALLEKDPPKKNPYY